MTKQLILENSTKTNNTGNLVFTPKITQAKEQHVASHLHTHGHTARPGDTGKARPTQNHQ